MDTDKIVEDILAHHGIKGMHWGIRRNPEAKAARKQARSERRDVRRQKRAAFAARIEKHIQETSDRRFEERATDFGTKVNLHNRAGELMVHHGDLDRINNKSEYIRAAEHGILLKDDHPVTRKYENEYMKAYVQRVKEAAGEAGTNYSGSRELAARRSNEVFGFSVYTRNVQHADDPSVLYNVKFVKDAQGFITGFEIQEDPMAQAATFVDQYLEHHGVKGQKWGVRRAEANSPKPVTVTTKKRGSKSTIVTKGGENQPVHPDAVAARSTGRQAKKSGLDTLSNKELQAYANRLDLEQRVSRLEKQDTHGKTFIQKFFANKKNQEGAKKFLNDEKNVESIKKGAAAFKAARTARKVAKVVV